VKIYLFEKKGQAEKLLTTSTQRNGKSQLCWASDNKLC
jgi:hypothetical protein